MKVLLTYLLVIHLYTTIQFLMNAFSLGFVFFLQIPLFPFVILFIITFFYNSPVLAAAPDIVLSNQLPPFFYYFLIFSYKYFLVPPLSIPTITSHIYIFCCVYFYVSYRFYVYLYMIQDTTFYILLTISTIYYAIHFYLFSVLRDFFFIITRSCYILYYLRLSLFLKIPVLAAAPDISSIFFLRAYHNFHSL